MTASRAIRIHEIARYYDTHDTSTELERAELETDTEWDPMVSTMLRLPKSLLDWVRERADAEAVDVTELIRWWIERQREADQDLPGASRWSLEERLRVLEEIVLGQRPHQAPQSQALLNQAPQNQAALNQALQNQAALNQAPQNQAPQNQAPQNRAAPAGPRQELERRAEEAVTQPLHVPHVRAAARPRKPPKKVAARRIR